MTTAPPIHYAKTVDGLYIAYQDVGPGTIPLFFNGMSPTSRSTGSGRSSPGSSGDSRPASGCSFRPPRLGHVRSDLRTSGRSSLLMDDVRRRPGRRRDGPGRSVRLGRHRRRTLAALFAATYPEQTWPLSSTAPLTLKSAPDHPGGVTDDEEDEWVAAFAPIWGDDNHAVECARLCYGDRAEDCPIDDPTFLRWWTQDDEVLVDDPPAWLPSFQACGTSPTSRPVCRPSTSPPL